MFSSVFIFVLCFCYPIYCASKNCDDYKDCASCASAKSWTGAHCRWCPLSDDNSCHAEGSLENKCSVVQQITDPLQCPSQLPTQVHLAFGSNNDEQSENQNSMTVSWASSPGSIPAKVPGCKYGTSPESLTTLCQATQTLQYLKDASIHHHCTLINLKVDTKYYYQCGDLSATTNQSQTLLSSIANFTTPPSHTIDRPISFFHLADWGYGVDGHAVATYQALIDEFSQRYHTSSPIDFIWHTGDIAYADDGFLHDKTSFMYEKIWDSFMEWLMPISQAIPYMTAPGNHECECHSPQCVLSPNLHDSLSNFSAYNARFKMPSEASNGAANMWYSFNYGSAHFIVINTETDYTNAPLDKRGERFYDAGGFGDQLSWLQADLEQAAKDREAGIRPWILVGGHRPGYSYEVNNVLLDFIGDLFDKYRIDVYLSGHLHSYWRSFPISGDYKNNGLKPSSNESKRLFVNPNNTIWVVSGGNGCDEFTEGTPGDSGVPSTLPSYVASDDRLHYTFGRMTIFNKSVLQYDAVDSDTHAVVDTFIIRKEV